MQPGKPGEQIQPNFSNQKSKIELPQEIKKLLKKIAIRNWIAISIPITCIFLFVTGFLLDNPGIGITALIVGVFTVIVTILYLGYNTDKFKKSYRKNVVPGI